jgi:hypothetical protein
MPSTSGAKSRQPSGSHDPDVAYLCRFVFRLKAERLARGMTLRDLEKATGINNAHLSRAERGITEAGVVVLRRWCRALDLNFEDVCQEVAKQGE